VRIKVAKSGMKNIFLKIPKPLTNSQFGRKSIAKLLFINVSNQIFCSKTSNKSLKSGF